MDDPPLTEKEKAAFKDITDGITDDSARKMLNHHVGLTRRWLKWCAGNGYTPSMSDLVRQIAHADIPRRRMTVAFAAALWQLAKLREKEAERERRRRSEPDAG